MQTVTLQTHPLFVVRLNDTEVQSGKPNESGRRVARESGNTSRPVDLQSICRKVLALFCNCVLKSRQNEALDHINRFLSVDETLNQSESSRNRANAFCDLFRLVFIEQTDSVRAINANRIQIQFDEERNEFILSIKPDATHPGAGKNSSQSDTDEEIQKFEHLLSMRIAFADLESLCDGNAHLLMNYCRLREPNANSIQLAKENMDDGKSASNPNARIFAYKLVLQHSGLVDDKTPTDVFPEGIPHVQKGFERGHIKDAANYVSMFPHWFNDADILAARTYILENPTQFRQTTVDRELGNAMALAKSGDLASRTLAIKACNAIKDDSKFDGDSRSIATKFLERQSKPNRAKIFTLSTQKNDIFKQFYDCFPNLHNKKALPNVKAYLNPYDDTINIRSQWNIGRAAAFCGLFRLAVIDHSETDQARNAKSFQISFDEEKGEFVLCLKPNLKSNSPFANSPETQRDFDQLLTLRINFTDFEELNPGDAKLIMQYCQPRKLNEESYKLADAILNKREFNTYEAVFALKLFLKYSDLANYATHLTRADKPVGLAGVPYVKLAAEAVSNSPFMYSPIETRSVRLYILTHPKDFPSETLKKELKIAIALANEEDEITKKFTFETCNSIKDDTDFSEDTREIAQQYLSQQNSLKLLKSFGFTEKTSQKKSPAGTIDSPSSPSRPAEKSNLEIEAELDSYKAILDQRKRDRKLGPVGPQEYYEAHEGILKNIRLLTSQEDLKYIDKAAEVVMTWSPTLKKTAAGDIACRYIVGNAGRFSADIKKHANDYFANNLSSV